jgi:hypothetical protein
MVIRSGGGKAKITRLHCKKEREKEGAEYGEQSQKLSSYVKLRNTA